MGRVAGAISGVVSVNLESLTCDIEVMKDVRFK
jgi:hypothetical protein